MCKYETMIYWSEEDQADVAEVPGLPGCMAHGESDEAAQVWARSGSCSSLPRGAWERVVVRSGAWE
ncbi:hypothetical protein BDD21_2702 [Thiocapsa rosea]|uniref:Type II toxin-antitoxin system HicB family antitoxin n=1 Tax=Thiocapsa rosea TaxID=69360 RepID=A0A495V785_9GAMM|nr:hypothetical protein BDD21_2702 [Thiocapsa rosea]